MHQIGAIHQASGCSDNLGTYLTEINVPVGHTVTTHVLSSFRQMSIACAKPKQRGVQRGCIISNGRLIHFKFTRIPDDRLNHTLHSAVELRLLMCSIRLCGFYRRPATSCTKTTSSCQYYRNYPHQILDLSSFT